MGKNELHEKDFYIFFKVRLRNTFRYVYRVRYNVFTILGEREREREREVR